MTFTMQTEPGQWAELRNTLKRLAEANQDYLMEVAIQRAFEERERKLREALGPFARLADEIQAITDQTGIRPEVIAKSCEWKHLIAARQALKENP